jgi:hypothetical protein
MDSDTVDLDLKSIQTNVVEQIKEALKSTIALMALKNSKGLTSFA